MKFTDTLCNTGSASTRGTTTGANDAPVVITESSASHPNPSKRTSEPAGDHPTQDPSSVLRQAGFKIKLVIKTAFGTQIDLAKKYNVNDVIGAMSGFNIRIKGQSVFVDR